MVFPTGGAWGGDGPPRMLGLVSGLDVEGMVQKLVRAAEEPLRNLERQKLLLTWKREAVQAVNRLFYDVYRALEPLRLQSFYRPQRVDVSRPEVLRAESLGSAAPTFEIAVDHLASPATLIGETIRVNGSPAARSETLAALGLLSPVTWTVEVSGPTSQVRSIDVLPTDTLADLEGKLRGAGLVARYDEGTGRISLATPATGASAIFTIREAAAGTPSLLDRLGFTPSRDPASGEAFARASGEDAQVTVRTSAGTVAVSSATNTLEMLGYRITLLQPSGTAPVTVRSSLDVDAVVGRVRGFVEAYNKLLIEVQARLSEPTFRDVRPVLPEEVKDLGETEANERNAKAKSGLLARDFQLQSLLGKLRARLAEQRVGGSYTSLSQIGVTTGSWQEKGLLHFDEAAFREAFARDADGVIRLLAGYTEKLADGTEVFRAGIFSDLYRDVYEAMRDLTRRAGGGFGLFYEPRGGELGRALQDLDERIQTKARQVQSLEERYIRQFTLLEQAVARANAQAAWLASLFSGKGS